MADEMCPLCRNRDISFVEDLTYEVILSGERLIIPNLTGLICNKCGESSFDKNSIKIIEKYTVNKVRGGYEIKISKLGGGKFGIYFPKDILRVMDINKSNKAILTPLSNRKMIIELISRGLIER